MAHRYQDLFAHLTAKREGAFVPFVMATDPSPDDSLRIIKTLVDAGADALELGVPFSDPSADGPTIQAAHSRALAGGATVENALEVVRQVRESYSDLPIGMLVYGNVPVTRGIEKFYRECHEAGADSVLLPDVPLRESQAFVPAARDEGIDTVFIAPARAGEKTLRDVARRATGYVYAISRDGVTGTERAATDFGLDAVVSQLQGFDSAPVLVGFGISTPDHVRRVCATGAAGAITGSAIVDIIAKHLVPDSRPSHSLHGVPAMKVADWEALGTALTDYVSTMKEATRNPATGGKEPAK